MARNFTITTPAETTRVGADGRGEMVFTVTNTSGIPNRGMGKIVPQGNTKAEWLALAGDPEREFPIGAVQQFNILANVPAGTPAGRYPWRFDIVSGLKTGEAHEQGPVVAFEVPASEAPKKKSMWWLWVAIAVGVVLLAVVLYLFFKGPKLVEVPDVMGQPRAQAEQKIKDAGLVPKVKTQLVRGIPFDSNVLSQDPKGGAKAEEGSTVTIVVPIRFVRPFPGRPLKPAAVSTQ